MLIFDSIGHVQLFSPIEHIKFESSIQLWSLLHDSPYLDFFTAKLYNLIFFLN